MYTGDPEGGERVCWWPPIIQRCFARNKKARGIFDACEGCDDDDDDDDNGNDDDDADDDDDDDDNGNDDDDDDDGNDD